MYFQARWFDPRIIQFNQPDTLIPDTFNVLDFNRYSYSRFNPIRYRDPSGHCTEDPYDDYYDYECFQLAQEISELYGGSYETYAGYDYDQLLLLYNQYLEDPEHHDQLIALRDEAIRLSDMMHAGEISDVEALALLLEIASPMYGDDVNSFLEDLGIVVGGLDTTGFWPVTLDENNPYYIGYSAFDPANSGFIDYLNPQDHNQVRHFIAGAAGGNWAGGIARGYLVWQEDAPEDKLLYELSFDFVDFLHNRTQYLYQPRLEEADDWVWDYLAQ